MARPSKEGLDYFPLDVDFVVNAKTEAIMGEFGAKGVLLMIYLLSAVYQNGYFLRWDKLKQMQLANRVEGSSPELVDQIVDRLIDYGTFDKELFNSAKVLTSHRIQETYLDATKRRKQQKPTLYWINDDNNPSSSVVNVDINPQSKVNKSKVNKSKKNISPRSKSSRTYAPTDRPYQIAEHLYKRILEHQPDLKKPDLQKWANEIRLAHERDKRDYDKLDKLVDWAQADDFWQGNILSTKKLREKYDTLTGQANREYKQNELNRRDGTPRDFGGSTRYRHEAKPEPIRTPQKGDEPF